jgi:hypothetical protein
VPCSEQFVADIDSRALVQQHFRKGHMFSLAARHDSVQDRLAGIAVVGVGPVEH